MNLRGGEILPMTGQEQRLINAREYFSKINIEALNVCKAYSLLNNRSSRLREEWLELCGVMKALDGKFSGNITGLIRLKQRVHEEYRNVRLSRLRLMKKCCEILSEVNRAYRVYMSLMKQHRKTKEEESCVRV